MCNFFDPQIDDPQNRRVIEEYMQGKGRPVLGGRTIATPRLTFVDLGSGAGESTIEAAKRGYCSLGVEINPSLLIVSKVSAFRQLPFRDWFKGECEFASKNLVVLPVKPYDVIFMFGVKPLLDIMGECGVAWPRGVGWFITHSRGLLS